MTINEFSYAEIFIMIIKIFGCVFGNDSKVIELIRSLN